MGLSTLGDHLGMFLQAHLVSLIGYLMSIAPNVLTFVLWEQIVLRIKWSMKKATTASV